MTNREPDLPADEGRKAYLARQHYHTNPYPESDWKHDEWWFGWKTQEECGGSSFDWKTDKFI